VVAQQSAPAVAAISCWPYYLSFDHAIVNFVDTMVALLIAIAKLIHTPTFEDTVNWAKEREDNEKLQTSPILFLGKMMTNRSFPDKEFE